MAVLVIAQYEVNDPAPYREYAQNAYPTVLAHEGEFVVFDPAAETLEGKPPGPQDGGDQVRVHRKGQRVVLTPRSTRRSSTSDLP